MLALSGCKRLHLKGTVWYSFGLFRVLKCARLTQLFIAFLIAKTVNVR